MGWGVGKEGKIRGSEGKGGEGSGRELKGVERSRIERKGMGWEWDPVLQQTV